MLKLNRNNTNFTLQLFEYFKGIKVESEYSFLKYYQNIIRAFVTDVDVSTRGLLIKHEMGLGKSILAIAIAIDMLREREPIILLTKSLEGNMRGAIHKYVQLRTESEPNYPLGRLSREQLDEWINDKFSFVSMNASNMLKQMNKAVEGDAAKEFDITLDKKFGEVLKMASLDGKLLIIDEAHNLFRAITNGSKNAIGLYDMVRKSRNLKVMFFTGTPIVNDPFELVPCFNMLSPGPPLLPESYKEFYKLYVKDKLIHNRGKFLNRILGLVSYVNHESTPGAALGLNTTMNVNFPTVYKRIVEYVHMDPEQYVIYQLARDKEQEEGKGGMAYETPALVKPRSQASSTYHVKSRQLGNYCPPSGYRDMKDPTKMPRQSLGAPKLRKLVSNVNKHSHQLGVVYSQFKGIGGIGIIAEYLKTLGWQEMHSDGTTDLLNAPAGEQGELDEVPIAIGGYDEHRIETVVGSAAPSVYDYLNNINNELASKGGYSNDVSYSSDSDNDDTGQPEQSDSTLSDFTLSDFTLSDFTLSDFTLSDNTDDYAGGADKPSRSSNPDPSKISKTKTFAIISGDINPKDRSIIQHMFNDPGNAYGNMIDLLLITSTGAEGLDLKNVRHVHILEPYFNDSRHKQIESRGARTNSHMTLKPEERTVQSYIYLAIPPKTEKGLTEYPSTTDTELYDDAIRGLILSDSFNEAINEASVECLVNNGKDCRVCSPSNAPLFTKDPSRDVRSVDPCTAVEEKSVIAKEVLINDVKYYYIEDPDSIYDYKIYAHDKTIDGYKALVESDPLFEEILNVITAKK